MVFSKKVVIFEIILGSTLTPNHFYAKSVIEAFPKRATWKNTWIPNMMSNVKIKLKTIMTIKTMKILLKIL